MKVNKIPFFTSISRNIKFLTTEFISDMKDKTLIESIKQIQATYAKGGFTIITILADGQFESLRSKIATLGINLNIVSAGEHVPEIERAHRMMKERTRGIFNAGPYDHLPARMVVELVYYVGFGWNALPAMKGISRIHGPRAIITGKEIDYVKHCVLEFGEYVHTHEEHDNSMSPRTIGAIALRPSGNEQGGYLFLSLSTGRVINRNKWTQLPIPEHVIQQVHRMARRGRAERNLTVTDRHNMVIMDANYDSDEDSSYETSDDESHSDDDNENQENDEPPEDPAYEDQFEQENNNNAGAPPNNDNQPDVVEEDTNNNEEEPTNEHITDEEATEQQDNHNIDDNKNNEDNIDNSDKDATIEQVVEADITEAFIHEPHDEDNNTESEEERPAKRANIEVEVDDSDDDDQKETRYEEFQRIVREAQEQGQASTRMKLRAKRKREYGHLHTNITSTDYSQYSIKKGLKLFGDAGAEAVKKEMKQLHDLDVLKPRHKKSMTTLELKRALQYLMFLKRKKTGTIKARGCADGRPQRKYISKDETASPTVSTEALFITVVIDAFEGRYTVTVDLPGAFMLTNQPNIVHIRLTGAMVRLLIDVAPGVYDEYVIHEKGEEVLYAQLNKALYGTVDAAFLFWADLTTQLEDMGFVTNPYDSCVANKMINDRQCTITWHVDDLKISHVEKEVVEEIVAELSRRYAKHADLTVERGNTHDYLGMVIRYEGNQAHIEMDQYVKDITTDAPEDMNGNAVTPATSHLFEVNQDDPVFLDTTTSELFHSMVARLLFLAKRARPDILVAVSFLCTRVKSPDVDDYKNWQGS